MPPPLAQPSSILPYALVSQPSVQLILQGTLPLAGCGTVQSLAPVPSMPATASELAVPTTNNSEERIDTPKTAAEKTKKEEVSAAAWPSTAPVLFGPDFRYSIRPVGLVRVVREQPAFSVLWQMNIPELLASHQRAHGSVWPSCHRVTHVLLTPST